MLSAILPVLQSTSPYLLLGPGDDCAVVAAPDSRYVVSTDLLVEGHDFLLSTSTAEHVAGKAVAQNLADIAAMGAVPTSLVVGLVAPKTTPLQWVTRFATALAEHCVGAGVAVAGGDLSGGPVLMVSITVFGDLQGRAWVGRDGARPGDVVALAGTVGRAAAGLDLLTAGWPEVGREASVGLLDVMSEAVAVQRGARPPLGAGPDAARAGATSMIDVSDGLLRDAGRIADASQVRLELDATAPPLADEVARLTPVADWLGFEPAEVRARGWVFAGGEDHGLLATFPPDAEVPQGFAVIGRVLAAEPQVEQVTVPALGPVADTGWDHFGETTQKPPT